MRGSPPLQALVLLLILIVIGLVGSQHLGSQAPVATEDHEHAATCTDSHPVDVEIELVFSSPPLSYTFKKPSSSGAEAEVALQSSSNIENPSYGNATLEAHKHIALWLDVVWPDDPSENTHHFVQVTITPAIGEEKKYSFFSYSKEMNETMELAIGDVHHE